MVLSAGFIFSHSGSLWPPLFCSMLICLSPIDLSTAGTHLAFAKVLCVLIRRCLLTVHFVRAITICKIIFFLQKLLRFQGPVGLLSLSLYFFFFRLQQAFQKPLDKTKEEFLRYFTYHLLAIKLWQNYSNCSSVI